MAKTGAQKPSYAKLRKELDASREACSAMMTQRSEALAALAQKNNELLRERGEKSRLAQRLQTTVTQTAYALEALSAVLRVNGENE